MKCCNVKPNLVNHALCRPLFFSKKLSKFLMCFVICLNINQYLNLFLHYSSTTRTEGKLTKWPVSWLSTNWLLAKKSLPEWFLYTNGGGGCLLNVLSQMQGLCMVQLDLLPPPPPPPPLTTPTTSPALWARGWGTVWSSPVPGVWGWGKWKITFLWFCKLCVISCTVCTKLQNSRPHIFKGKFRRVVGEE